MLPKRVLYYGKDEDLAQQIPLRAGPFDLIYEQGDLRYIRIGNKEVIRRVYVAVRDRNWGTVAAVLSQVEINRQTDSFCISYSVENRQNDIHFQWRGRIQGDRDGTITFTMDGEALTTFWRNRIGFCVLHPADLAGRAAVVEHVDGTREAAVFPVDFVADQPVLPFAEIKGMGHDVSSGLWADVTFSGDIFEMEDQRNWTDASYKTFCTPLRLPYPVEIQAGTKVVQSMTICTRREKAGLPPTGGGETQIEGNTTTLTILGDDAIMPVPKLGLGAASHGQALSEKERGRLRALNLHHLRVDLDLTAEGYLKVLEQAASEARGIGTGLEIALFASEHPEGELAELRRNVDRLRPPVRAWLCFPKQESYLGGSVIAPVLEAAQKYLQDYDPAVPIYAGTNTDFIFLKRNVPPLEGIDGLTFAVCPQVHAFDNASLIETLQAQGQAVGSARRLGLGKAVMVSPITFKMRFNPYATAAAPKVPSGVLPPQADVRQMSLFGAVWTLGSIQALAEAGASGITYYETTGVRGVMETERGSNLTDIFRSLPGGVYPLYHILAAVGEFSGGSVLPVKVSRPLQAAAVSLQKEGRQRLLVANLQPSAHTLRLQGADGKWLVRWLDETNIEDALRSPENFQTQPGKVIQSQDGEFELNCLPYATAFLDRLVEGE